SYHCVVNRHVTSDSLSLHDALPISRKRCPTCGGDGRTLREACRRCSATGVVPRAEVVTVTVPPGIESGSRIAVPGRGHAGALGRSEEHTSALQSREKLVCRLLPEKK